MLKKSRMLICISAIAVALTAPMTAAADDALIISAGHTEPIFLILVEAEQLKPVSAALSQTESIRIFAYDTDPTDVLLVQPGGAEVTVSGSWIFGESIGFMPELTCSAMPCYSYSASINGNLPHEVGWRA